MRSHRGPFAVILALACAATMTGATARTAGAPLPSIATHVIRLDEGGHLLSWSDADSPYAQIARLAWHAFSTKFSVQDNGVVTWLTYSRFDPDTFDGINWPHNPASLYAMLTDSAVLWYAFSGDRGPVGLADTALRYQLAHGTTPPDFDWASVPYASANPGDLEYRGADDEWCGYCGRGDGLGVIEPDKVGELGFAYAQMFELTGSIQERDAAIACADALAKHVRPGDERRSPWPFRVAAQTNIPREEYSSNLVGALMLFDELDRLGLGDVDAYRHARAIALSWL
ncbi:MAG: hypothetical protein ACREJ3_06165, partial [Polyangiaceae bacterium]